MTRHYFFPALVFCLLLGSPLRAEWDTSAVQALPYLYHEQELKADIAAMDEGLQRLNRDRLRDYYLADVNNLAYVRQAFPEPLVYDDLSGSYVSLYQDMENDFLRRVDSDKDGLLSRLERDERQEYRNQISAAAMVQLKDFYLKYPAFFDLPLSYSAYQLFAADVEAEPKHDLPARNALAVQLAGFLRLQEASYVVDGDAVHAVSPDRVEKNLVATLTNTYSAQQLADMVAMAESEAGQEFLRMKDGAFKNRFITLQELYRVELAAAIDAMRSRMASLPPLVFYQPVFYRHHHRPHAD